MVEVNSVGGFNYQLTPNEFTRSSNRLSTYSSRALANVSSLLMVDQPIMYVVAAHLELPLPLQML